MDLAEAIKKASEILDEELAVPTVDYRPTNVTFERSLQELSGVTKNLIAQRESRPRTVEEVKGYYAFSSTNFNLLIALFGQVPKQDRNAFMSALVKRVPSRSSYRRDVQSYAYPRFSAHISELPLLAEFFIRTGYLTLLLQEAGKMTRPTYGLLLLLMQLEEAIAVNFRIFTDEQLELIPDILLNLHEEMFVLIFKSTRPRGATGPATENPRYVPGFEALANEVLRSIDGIREECRKAHYFYLKGELQDTVNLEVENDKVKVVGFLESLGFDPILILSLRKAEDLYRSSSDAFDLKSCLGHLRSFYEHLHIDGGTAVAAKSSETVVQGWDPVLEQFKNYCSRASTGRAALQRRVPADPSPPSRLQPAAPRLHK
ncbi:MAG TPA: hypothetical protein VII95_21325 [Terriglobales bacterium]